MGNAIHAIPTARATDAAVLGLTDRAWATLCAVPSAHVLPQAPAAILATMQADGTAAPGDTVRGLGVVLGRLARAGLIARDDSGDGGPTWAAYDPDGPGLTEAAARVLTHVRMVAPCVMARGALSAMGPAGVVPREAQAQDAQGLRHAPTRRLRLAYDAADAGAPGRAYAWAAEAVTAARAGTRPDVLRAAETVRALMLAACRRAQRDESCARFTGDHGAAQARRDLDSRTAVRLTRVANDGAATWAAWACHAARVVVAQDAQGGPWRVRDLGGDSLDMTLHGSPEAAARAFLRQVATREGRAWESYLGRGAGTFAPSADAQARAWGAATAAPVPTQGDRRVAWTLRPVHPYGGAFLPWVEGDAPSGPPSGTPESAWALIRDALKARRAAETAQDGPQAAEAPTLPGEAPRPSLGALRASWAERAAEATRRASMARRAARDWQALAQGDAQAGREAQAAQAEAQAEAETRAARAAQAEADAAAQVADALAWASARIADLESGT